MLAFVFTAPSLKVAIFFSLSLFFNPLMVITCNAVSYLSEQREIVSMTICPEGLGIQLQSSSHHPFLIPFPNFCYSYFYFF